MPSTCYSLLGERKFRLPWALFLLWEVYVTSYLGGCSYSCGLAQKIFAIYWKETRSESEDTDLISLVHQLSSSHSLSQLVMLG